MSDLNNSTRLSRRTLLQGFAVASGVRFLPGIIAQVMKETMVFHTGEVTPEMEAAMPNFPECIKKMYRQGPLQVFLEDNKHILQERSDLAALPLKDGELNLPDAMNVYRFRFNADAFDKRLMQFFDFSVEHVRACFQRAVQKSFSNAVKFIPAMEDSFLIIPTYRASARDLGKLDAWLQPDFLVKELKKIPSFIPKDRPFTKGERKEIEAWMDAMRMWFERAEKIAPSRAIEIVTQPA